MRKCNIAKSASFGHPQQSAGIAATKTNLGKCGAVYMAPIVNFGKITAGYGEINSIHKTPHTGIDFNAPANTPLHAPIDGIVSRVADYGDASLGKAVFIQMKDGSQYVLGHLSEIKVKVGQHVHHGDLIALSGSSGRSTAPHLHFGMFDPSGTPVNPGNIDFSAFTTGGDNVIVKMNGAVLNPLMDWVNDKADHFIQWEAETVANGVLWGVGQLLKAIAPMVPELAGISICVFITIGMFTNFAKWLARSLLVFMGAVVWLTLAHA